MNKYYEHQQLIKRFKLLSIKEIPGFRVKDQTVGSFILIRFIQLLIKGKCSILDWKKYQVKINKKGDSDCYATFPLKINNKNVLIIIHLEFKTGNAKQTSEQKQYERKINKMGGKYFLVRNEYNAISEIKDYIKSLN